MVINLAKCLCVCLASGAALKDAMVAPVDVGDRRHQLWF
ncbi:hypothetical protein HMPREF9278_1810 [Mobiluncus mulieris FB024-16]|nr:hypothetical protein HMPREF9278_1810 [Mobiluncus mulieris FB024-16]